MKRQTSHMQVAMRNSAQIDRRKFLALCCAAMFPGAANAQTHMRLSHAYPAGSIVDMIAREFSERVKRESDIEFEIFPNGLLYRSSDGMEALLNGSLDAWVGSAPAEEMMQSLQVFDVPFLIRSSDHFRRIVEASADSILSKLFSQRDLVLIAPIATGAHAISTSGSKIIDPFDLKGRNLVVRNGAIAESGFSELGANTVRLPLAELFPASQAGYLDAYAGPIQDMFNLDLYKLHHSVTLTQHAFGIAYLVMNRHSVDKIPFINWRKIGREISLFSIKLSEDADREALDFMASSGVEVVKIDPFEFEYTKKFSYDLYLSKFPEAYDVLNFIEDRAK